MEPNHPYKGKFVILEGCEGAGKTTLASLLKAALEREDYDVIATQEPNCRTRLCRELSKKLNDEKFALSYEEILDLLLVCRKENFGRIVIPALKKGKIVLCDRSYPSTIAYQHDGYGMDLTEIMKKDAISRKNVSADLILLLDIVPSIGLNRKKIQGRFENESFEFHQRVHDGYLKQWEDDQDGIWWRVDAKYSVEVTREKALAIIYKTILRSKNAATN